MAAPRHLLQQHQHLSLSLFAARSVTPRFTSQLQDVTTDAGKNVTLQCQVTGSPEPSVMWRRNGLMVQDVPDFVQTFAGGVARLQILAARDKHGGRYECMAQNEAGHASTSCHVTVTASTGKYTAYRALLSMSRVECHK